MFLIRKLKPLDLNGMERMPLGSPPIWELQTERGKGLLMIQLTLANQIQVFGAF